MLFKKRKTEEFHFTPEQEACLANCRQLTNDELRILNGGGSYKGMPSSVQMQQGLSGGSSNNDSSSSSGTSKEHNGMPSDVEAMLEHSGSSSATETNASAGQTTVTSVTYPTTPVSQPSEPKPVASEPAVNHETGSASGSGSTNYSSSSASSSSTNNSSPSASTASGSSGNGSLPFPKPYAGAYEHGSYAEAQKETEKQKAQEVPDSLDEAVEFMQQSDIFQDKTKQSISRGLVEGVYYAEKSRRGFIRKITEFFGIGNTFGRGQIGQNAYNDVKTKLNNELNEYAEMYGIPVPEDVRDAVKIPELEDFIVTSYLCLCIDKGQKNGRSPDDAIKYGTGFYHGGWNSLVTAQSLSGSTLPYVGTEFVLKTGASAWRDIAAYIDDVYAMR